MKNILIKLLINIILASVAFGLALLLFPIGLLFSIIHLIVNYSTKNTLSFGVKFFLAIAISIDQLGNVVCQHLFNHCLIKKESRYKFGNVDETISSVLGKNKLEKTLTILGIYLLSLLEFIDSNHGVKSIEEDEIF